MKWLIKTAKPKWLINKTIGLGFSLTLLISIASSFIAYKSTNEILQAKTIDSKIVYEDIKNILYAGSFITFIVLTASAVIIFRDMAKRNYFEKELAKAKEIAEHSVRVKERFVANISHEIRTPMNAILGLSKILLKNNPDLKQKEYLGAIKTSADILIVIINDILDLSKAHSGKMTFEEADFNISHLLSSVTELLQSKVDEKNLKLVNCFDENIPEILMGDAVRLNQIIFNLVGNAIKFTEKGEIRLITDLVSLDNKTVTLKFSVKDTGIGIPEDRLSNIFEGFSQGSTEITRKYGGTGLGLNIVKELVELQGGIVSVESQIGKGSVFSFILNFKKNNNKNINKNSLSERTYIPSHLGRVKVLLVEDNPINQLVAQTILTDFGVETVLASNGKIAIEKIQSEFFDIILMDIQMPEMDGYEVTNYIRTKMTSPLNNIPIIAMTAYASESDAKKSINSGMNDYISKPFDENTLYSKIARLVSGTKKSIVENKNNEYVNLDYLKSLAKGNMKFIEDVISLFLVQTPVAIDNMKSHLNSKTWQLLLAEAHKLKPSFRFMGIKELEEVVHSIEESVEKQENLDLLHGMISKIEMRCNIAFKELKEELKKIKLN